MKTIENRNAIIETLEKTKEKLATPDTWVKGHHAVNKDGYNRFSYSPDACKWCLYSAINVVASDGMLASLTRSVVTDVVCDSDSEERYSSISYFNDHKDTEHSDVIDVINQAIVSMLYSDVE